jgi:hypothetical protein
VVITGDPSATDDVTGTIARLVGSSLVRTDHRSAPARYRMLEAIREYAAEQLRGSGEEDCIRARELEYLVGLARNVRRDEFFGPPVPENITALDVEHDNVREMLERLVRSGDGDQAARLAAAMGTYWFERGHVAEGQRWLAQALDLTSGSRSLERGLALVATAATVSHFEDFGRRLPQLQEATEIIQEQGDDRQLHYALTYLRFGYGMRGKRAEANAVQAEEKVVRARLGGRWLEVYTDMTENIDRGLSGHVTEACTGLRQCATAFLELGDETFAARMLMFSGVFAYAVGDRAAAREDLSQSVGLIGDSGIRGTQAHAQLTLAHIAMDLGDCDAAAPLDECRTTFEMIGDVRCAAVCTRSLGSLALDAGRLDEATDQLRASIDGLVHDRPALAVVLADLALIQQRCGKTREAGRLVAAAKRLARDTSATPPGAGERTRIDAAARAIGGDAIEACSPDDGSVDLDEILEIARRV